MVSQNIIFRIQVWLLRKHQSQIFQEENNNFLKDLIINNFI